jgi:hypothetical protein
MNLAALQHIIRAAQALAEDRAIFVLGSASLLASYPELGNPESPLASTYDADLLPDPFDELTGTMLDEALGENRAYYLRHGYHADILRDTILETLPSGWRERLVSVPGCAAAHALEPHDLAAVKLLVGRPKDISLLAHLYADGLLNAEVVRTRLDLLDIQVERVPRLHSNFHTVFGG